MAMVTPHPLDRFAGSWAVVTGSARAQGLGFAFARQLANRGLNLALVDVLENELQARATELRAQSPVEVRCIAADLADLAVYPRICDELADVEIGVLVCNHMYTPHDTPQILDMPLDVHNSMIDINSRAYVNLIHRFAAVMRAKGRGAVIVVSSGAGLATTPYTGAYAANKAFQIVFGEALWYELRGTGVDVLVMVAGLMNTQGDALSQYPQWMIQDRDEAAAQALNALGRKHLVMTGRANRLFTLVQTRLMSRRRAVTRVGRFMSAGLGKKKSQR